MITVAGLPCTSMRLTLPLTGIPTARVTVADETPLSGAVDIANEEGDVFKGFVVKANVFAGGGNALIVGGKGGLREVVPAAHYKDAKLRDALGAVLGSVGETSDASSLRGILDTPIPFWSRLGVTEEATAKLEVARLAEYANANWRVLLNGRVWVGVDAWAPLADDFPAVVIKEDTTTQTAVATERFKLVPGVAWRGYRIEKVEYFFNEHEHLRAYIWTQ